MSRKKQWQSHLGNRVNLEGVEDTHLANLIDYMKKTNICIVPLKDAKEEAKLRGLSREYLEKAPYPYKDGLGNWIIWDYEVRGARRIGRYAR